MANKTQLDKILEWAKSKIGSSKYNGYCQKFVREAAAKGIGEHERSDNAKEACRKWLIPGTQNDLKPPAAAAVYFKGSSRGLGHVALSDGNGFIFDPVSKVEHKLLTKNMHNGYLGYGWEGGIKPEGSLFFENSILFSPTLDSFKENILDNETGNESNNNIDLENITGTEVPESVEIYCVNVKYEYGVLSAKTASTIKNEFTSDNDIFLLIETSGGKIYRPYVCSDIKVVFERTGAPGKMTFSILDIDGMKIENGNAVAFRFKGDKIFFGYIFENDSESDREIIEITCYDQLRYFKNHDSFVYNKKYSELLKWLCGKYGLKIGIIEDTAYKIPERVEEGSLFDICAQAAYSTFLSSEKHFVLYDDFGAISLKDRENMMLDILLDKDTAGKWQLKNSIDSDVYNRIIIKQDSSTTGERSLFIANGSETQKKWGVLTLFDEADENTSASSIQSTVKYLLKYHNKENKRFSANKCLGHTKVRGGSSLFVNFDLGNGEKALNIMIVDRVEHTFSENYHLMDMKLIGGDYT